MRGFFASRTLSVAALLWVVGFFCVFMPAHRRGMIALPGGASVAVAVNSATNAANQADVSTTSTEANQPFCPLCMPADNENGPDAPVNCAICHLKVNFSLPPVMVLPPVFVEQLDYLIARFEQGASPFVVSQSTLRGRAPPVFL